MGAIATAYAELEAEGSAPDIEDVDFKTQLADVMAQARAVVADSLDTIHTETAETGEQTAGSFGDVAGRLARDFTAAGSDVKAGLSGLATTADDDAEQVGDRWAGAAEKIRAAFVSAVSAARDAIGRSSSSAQSSSERVSKDADDATGDVGHDFGGIGAGIGAQVAVMAGFEMLKGLVSGGETAAAQGRVTAAVIKSTGDAAHVTAAQLANLADTQSVATGIAAGQIRSAENVLLTFKGIQNQAGATNDVYNQSVVAVENLSTVMGVSTTSAAKTLGKALNDPATGLTALTRIGVTFTAQQKAQIKALVASGNQLGAQKVILDRVNSSFGGTAAAAADPMKQLSAAIEAVKEQAGEAVLPAIDSLTRAVAELLPAVGPLIGQIGAGLARALTAVLPAVGVLVPAVGQLAAGLAGLLGQGLSLLVPVLVQLAGVVEPLIRTILDADAGELSAFMHAFRPLLPAIMAYVEAMIRFDAAIAVAAGGYLIQWYEVLGQLITAVLPLVPTLGRLLVAFLPLEGAILNIDGALVQLAEPVLIPLIQVVVAVVQVGLEPLIDAVGSLTGPLQAAAGTLAGLAGSGSSLISLMQPVVTVLTAVVAPAWQAIAAQLRAAWDLITGIVSAAVTAVRAAVTVGVDLVRGFITVQLAVSEAIFETAWDAISGLVTAAWDLIRGQVQAAMDLVRAAIRAVTDLVEGKWGAAWQTVSGLPGQIVGDVGASITGAAGTLLNAGTSAGHAILSGVSAGYRTIIGMFDGIGSTIANAVEAIGGDPTNIGKSLINAIVKDIEASPKAVVGAIEHLLPGGGLVKKILSLDAGGAIPGQIGSPTLVLGHGGEYLLSVAQLAQLRTVGAAPTPAPRSTAGVKSEIIADNDHARQIGELVDQGIRDALDARQLRLVS